MHSWNQFFLETNIILPKELLKEWMTAKSLEKMNTLQITDDCHSFWYKNRYVTSRDRWLQSGWLNKQTAL